MRIKRQISFFFIFTLLMVTSLAYGSSSEERFLEGNQLYLNEQYEEALSKYQGVERKGPAIWFNMGNCYHMLENRAEAIACWRRAQHAVSAGRYLEIEKLIRTARSSDSDRLSMVDQGLLFMRAYVYTAPLLLLQLLLLCAWGLLFALSFFIRRQRRVQIILSASLCVSLAGALWVRYRSEQGMVGVVCRDNTPLFAGPNERYHAVASCGCAQEVTIQAQLSGWYKVWHNGQAGWVKSDEVKVI